MARRGEIILIISDLLAAEMRRAPAVVRRAFEALPEDAIDLVEGSMEAEHLRDMYLEAGVVPPGASEDAHHVAIATVERADIIVSWNFRHIVHIEKIRGFNAVNLREGYPTLEIRSPREVVWL